MIITYNAVLDMIERYKCSLSKMNSSFSVERLCVFSDWDFVGHVEIL